MSSSRRAAGSETSSEAAQVRPARTSEQWTCLVSAGDVPSSATAGAALFAHVLCACSLSRVHAAADRPHRRVRARHRRRHHSRPRLHLLRVATRSSFGCAALIRLLAALAVRARRARACRARAGRARAGRARAGRPMGSTGAPGAHERAVELRVVRRRRAVERHRRRRLVCSRAVCLFSLARTCGC